MKRIIGIGNALIDILSRIESDDLLRQMNLPKGSMQLLDDERYREISATLARMDTQRATGGSACNTMLALAQLAKTGHHRQGRAGRERTFLCRQLQNGGH